MADGEMARYLKGIPSTGELQEITKLRLSRCARGLLHTMIYQGAESIDMPLLRYDTAVSLAEFLRRIGVCHSVIMERC